MSRLDPGIQPPPSPVFRKTGAALLFSWGLGVLAVFLSANLSLIAPLQGLARTAGLALLSAAAFQSSGWRLLRGLKKHLDPPLDPLLELAMELGLGAGLASAGLFALGIFGLYRPEAAVLMLILLLAGDPRPWWRELSARLRLLKPGPPRFLSAALILVGAMTCLESLAPAASQDALVYHLAVPARYIREGGMVYIPGNFFASFPQNVEMLFTLALLLHDSTLANWYHWLLGAAAVLAVAALARQLSGGRGGLLAAAVFATIPTACLIAAWAYVDLGLILFQVLAIACFLHWHERQRLAWLALAGVFAGLAGGCKYTGGAAAILIALAIFVSGALWRKTLGRSLLEALGFGSIAGLLVSPWLIKNFCFTGNPLYPFLFQVFGGRDWDAERAAVLTLFLGEWGGGGGPADWPALLFKLTFSSRFFSIENFDGMIGPVFLLALPGALAGLRRAPAARWAFCFAAGFSLLWIATTRQIRFLLPALACASAWIGAGLPAALDGLASRAVLALCYAGVAFNTLLVSTHFASHNPLPVVLGFEDPERYLAREVPGGDYPIFAAIDKKLPAEARLLFGPCGNPGFLCRRDFHADAIFETRTLKQILERGLDPDGVLREFQSRGFTHLLFRWELVFDGTGKKSGLSLEQQLLLAEFLNRHAALEASASSTRLYRLGQPAAAGKGGAP
ncbi:MAG: glycosyltransferase family 39 protein [Planctomycetes bacterium]|nr:glycosyltransferase family 39 protein [Planctomycetota bacterium]